MSIVADAKKIDKEFILEEKQDDKHVKVCPIVCVLVQSSFLTRLKAIEKDLKKVEKKESGLAKEAGKAEKVCSTRSLRSCIQSDTVVTVAGCRQTRKKRTRYCREAQRRHSCPRERVHRAPEVQGRSSGARIRLIHRVYGS
jgi:hypothetical protein